MDVVKYITTDPKIEGIILESYGAVISLFEKKYKNLEDHINIKAFKFQKIIYYPKFHFKTY